MENFENSALKDYFVPVKDINAVCRCCLASEELVEIFCNDTELNSEVEECLCPAYIPLDPNDGLPNLICASCVAVLRTWHQFRLKCDGSYKLLERLQECPIDVLEEAEEVSVDPGMIIEDVKIEEIYVRDVELDDLQQQNEFITADQEKVVSTCVNIKVEPVRKNEQKRNIISATEEMHRAKVIGKELVGGKKKRYVYLRQCPICGIVLKRGLKEHIMIHNDPTGRPFKCVNCDKTYCRKENLRQHQEREHMMIRYPCDICGKIFSTKDILSAHRKLHNSDVQFNCDQCDQVFKSNKYLYKHKQKHLGIKKFICSYCGKSFMVGEYLKDHLRIHTGEKPFDCKICGKAFRTTNHLRQHTRTHSIQEQDDPSATSEKEFRCDQCDLSFSRNKLLNTHRKQHLEEHLLGVQKDLSEGM